MDSRTLSEATGMQAGTLNAWIQRGYVPGMGVETSGRRRDFDIKTATRIGIMVELTRFGFGAPLASFSAGFALEAFLREHNPCFLIARPIQQGPTGEVGQKFGFTFNSFESEAQLPKALAEAPPDQVPSVYLIINVGRIAAKMQQAEKEWQLRRKTRPARKTDG